LTGNYKSCKCRQESISDTWHGLRPVCVEESGSQISGGGSANKSQEESRFCKEAGFEMAIVDYSVSRVNFMVKLLRACVWMPWRK
jgi:hypothetical protein